MRASQVFGLVAALGLFAACNGASAVDVNDKDDVLAALNDHMGWDAEADDVCLVTDPAFPDVAVIGEFAYDRGCDVAVVLADGEWLQPGAASSPVLQAAGWADGNDDARAALAMQWIEFGVFPFQGIVSAGNEDFSRDDAPAYAAPQTEPDGNGGIVVTLWVEDPAGMLPQSEYKLWALTFDRDGRQVRTRVLDDFVVKY